ncbi:hypothetical protein [Methylobacterium sp. J-030]|uniref:hypothetical protein n=1 Tax=Methylobacterium sp. J-030 TaxID=2836627 RepID=UPI001FB9F9C3|nr:hypothetical protein [Methylobacterium sp. J-030]
MTVQDTNSRTEPRIKRCWRQHLVLPMLLTGGLLTLAWIAVLIAIVLQIIGAVAGTGGGRLSMAAAAAESAARSAGIAIAPAIAIPADHRASATNRPGATISTRTPA